MSRRVAALAGRGTQAAGDPWGWAAARWEAVQEAYVPERTAQIGVALDAVRGVLGRDPERVLDLGTGTGTFARAALAAFPRCAVTGLDVDPFLLELGRRAYPGDRVDRVSADLRAADWPAALPRATAGRFDAVVSATALHWLSPADLARVYAQVRELVGPGGVLADVDTVPPGDAASAVGRHALGRTLRAQPAARAGAPTWARFWSEVEAVAAFGPLLDARSAALGPRAPRVFVRAVENTAALRGAGFRDVGEVWRRDASAVVVAVG